MLETFKDVTRKTCPIRRLDPRANSTHQEQCGAPRTGVRTVRLGIDSVLRRESPSARSVLSPFARRPLACRRTSSCRQARRT